MKRPAAIAGLPSNPIFERERIMRARSWGLPLGISLYICTLGVAALLQFSWATSGAPDNTPTASDMARAAFLVVSLQLIVVFLAIPPAAASAIASERERGMFDLLLLGRLSPRSIVWSELWAALAYRALLLLTAAPVLLAVFLYAGLGVGQFLLTELLTLAVVVSLGAVALLLSILMTRALSAALATYGLVLALRFGIVTTGALFATDVPLNPAPGAPQSVYPLIFATPFYALKALMTGPAPAGAHLGHLVGLLARRKSDPASWGPVVQPWQAALAGMAAVTVICMALATRLVAGRRPPSRRRLRWLRRLALIKIRLPQRRRRPPAAAGDHDRQAGAARGIVAVMVAAAAAVATLVGLGGIAGGETPQASPPLTVTAAPRWGRSTPGTWTPYLASLSNAGPTSFEGDLVLVPETAPPRPPPPPVREKPPAPTFPTIGLGGTQFTVPDGPGAPSGPGEFPTHRSPVYLAAGATSTVTLLVVEAPFGYRGELRDRSGARVAVAPATGGPQADQTKTVALLGRGDEVASTLRGLDELLGPNSGTLTVLGSARDVPDSALLLGGLQAMVIHSFDTATLGPSQLSALHAFVGLGGNLVLTGGSEGAGMLRPLPDVLVPLVPKGTTTVPMGPLADLVARTTTATATVVTGELRSGRVMLATDDGIPLVVEADYGAGRVVQLAYDPQSESLASDPLLRSLAWQQAISRVLTRFPTGGSNLVAPPRQLWAPALGEMGWPRWPAPHLWLLIGYAILGGPAAYGVLRAQRRLASIWATAAVVAVALAVLTGLAPALRGDGREAVVRVTRAAPGDVALISSYHGLQGTTGRARTLTPAEGVSASTVFAPPALMSIDAVPDGTAAGAGGGVVASHGDKVDVTVPTKLGDVRNLGLVSLERRPALESSLRLMDAGPPGGGGLRMLGTVTNHSSKPVRRLRAQLPEGALARIADVIGPGASLPVDVTVASPESMQPGSGSRADREELVMFAAAARAFSRGGQVVVAGIEQADAGDLAVVTEVVPLGGAERVVALSGTAAPVAVAPSSTAERIVVQDHEGLPGLKAAKIAYSTYDNPPEVFDWTTRTWRLLPPGNRGAGVVDGSPIKPSELRPDGLVRTRVRLSELGPCCVLTN